jgi:hypothetical protein
MVTPMPNGATLLGDGFAEAFDAPLGGVVGRVAGEGDLTAVGGDLDDAAAALGAQVRQHGVVPPPPRARSSPAATNPPP